MLVYLKLNHCFIKTLDIPFLPNLLTLDLSSNLIIEMNLAFLSNLPQIKHLVLRNNPIRNIAASKKLSESLLTLDLYHTNISSFNREVFSTFSNLQTLNLSNTMIQFLENTDLGVINSVETLDISKCKIHEFSMNVIKNLTNLRILYADSYKLCCRRLLPEGFNTQNCHSEKTTLDHCESLLQSDAYRVMLWLFAILSLLGNAFSFIIRTFFTFK